MILLQDLDLRGKRVFLRVDFNVPLDENRKIRDDTRIKAALPTINYLIEHEARVVAASHLGRPGGQPDSRFSLNPVAERLSELISSDVFFAPDVVGEEVTKLKKELREGLVLLLENLRFHPGEKANDDSFARQLAQEIDYYVNDAFGACHRAHASIVGISHYIESSAAGFLLQKEIEYLSKALHSPRKPYTVILGGAKVSDKIPVIENLMNKADEILIGGAMAYIFFKAQGYGVGRSLVEDDKIEIARQILEKARKNKVSFYLPSDHVVASKMEPDADAIIVDALPLPPDVMALDIGPKTVEEYSRLISRAQTIFWNGPLGVFEIAKFASGTIRIAEAVANSRALSIIGGGDSVAAVYKAGVSDKISHISTGGGASLEYLAKETLPGLKVLEEKKHVS